MSTATIKNKLEIIAGVIKLPGCEPTSAFSSDTLNENIDCPASSISVQLILDNVPGTKVEITAYPSTRYLVLPSGPPPSSLCPQPQCLDDWYAIFKELAREDAEGIPSTPLEGCDSFPHYTWHCQNQT